MRTIKYRGDVMERTIGLLLTVVFAFTLFSPPLKALDHPWNDPRYTGELDKEASLDADPWTEIDKNNEGILSYISYWYESTKLYFELFIVDFKKDNTKWKVVRKVEINSDNNTNSDDDFIDVDQNTDKTNPGDS